MTPQVRSSASPPRLTKWRILAVLLVGILLVGGEVARRAVYGHGHWHQLARSLYHQIKGGGMTPAMAAERADAPMVLYDDQLENGWQDWSWITRDLNSTAVAHGGRKAIRLTPKGFQGLFLHHDALNTSGYGAVQVYVHGDASSLNVCLADADNKWGPKPSLARFCKPDANGWSVAHVPLSALGVPKEGETITGLVFQAASNDAAPPVDLDDISLLPDTSLPAAPTQVTVAVSVDAVADKRPISPFIYGMAFAPPDYLSDLHLAVNRWGGNDKSRYNWVQGNAVNAARDWGWRNRAASDGAIPAGPSGAADLFVQNNSHARAASLLTVPTLGWVARDTDNSHASQNVPNIGGDPLTNAEGAIAGYDPAANRALTSVRSVARKNAPFVDAPNLAGGVVYQDEWVHHLVTRFGGAAKGGVRFYAMDNEPDLWDSTQTDVHPARMGYDDVLREFLEYADAVKAVDPDALVTGPVSWGWPGYEYSALDRGNDNFQTHADFSKHGGIWFLPWFLKQAAAHDAKTGHRTLDVLDVHYYPQGDGVYGGRQDKDADARRLRATRSLWDPAYKDESWIGQPVRLFPRLQEWIDGNYPGTKIGLTEWNFGADGSPNGGLAVGDALGIFGRQGVFLANYWAFPPKNSPGYLAFKMYRNADGAGHGLGDIACRASSANQEQVSCYSAVDSQTGELTVMLLNKMPRATATVPLTLRGVAASARVKTWRFFTDNTPRITPLPSLAEHGGSLTVTLPPYSMTLLRVPTTESSR